MADQKEKNIAEFCRPLFGMICDWSAKIQAGGTVDASEASSNLTTMLDQMRASSKHHPELARQFMMVELPLLFFIDYIMQELMGISGKWNELAFERNELAGDEKFFDLLEQTLGNPTDLATERVEVFYQCMALGFSGTYEPSSPELAKYFSRCALRLGLAPELVETGRISPAAYSDAPGQHRYRRFNQRRWRMAGIGCLVGFLVVFIINVSIFQYQTYGLLSLLEGVIAETRASRPVSRPVYIQGSGVAGQGGTVLAPVSSAGGSEGGGAENAAADGGSVERGDASAGGDGSNGSEESP